MAVTADEMLISMDFIEIRPQQYQRNITLPHGIVGFQTISFPNSDTVECYTVGQIQRGDLVQQFPVPTPMTPLLLSAAQLKLQELKQKQ